MLNLNWNMGWDGNFKRLNNRKGSSDSDDFCLDGFDRDDAGYHFPDFCTVEKSWTQKMIKKKQKMR